MPMRRALGLVLVGLACVGIVLGVTFWNAASPGPGKVPHDLAAPVATPPIRPGLESFPDPNAPGTSARVFIDSGAFDQFIFSTALSFTGPIRDAGSLDEVREAVRGRGRRGLTALRAQYDRLRVDSAATSDSHREAIRLEKSIAALYMHEGQFAEAASWFRKILDPNRGPEVSAELRAEIHVLLGIAALRRGEVENCLECVGPSSCIFPIAREAVHTQQAGSREAIDQFKAYLDHAPGDLRVRWLLNIAYMTLGEYPDKVPPAYLIPLDRFRSVRDLGRFENVALRAGLTSRGPNLAGGSIFDDFDGDHRPDLLTTSIDADLGAALFINRGDGTFEDRSAASGLGQQTYVLNVARGDYDNDGNPDVLFLRGAWEQSARLSLLRNKGGGRFEDVTIASGLGAPISTESAAWGDYDDDGRLDLFVCGEYHSETPDAANGCRLYHNQGDGTFRDVAAAAGVVNERVAKGCAWGDFDGDSRLDLYVANLDAPWRLYHNEGNGTFRDVAPEMHVAGPRHNQSFSCWFWDFDNDGRLDLFVNDYHAELADVLGYYLGLIMKDPGHPHLYRNLGRQGFRDVSLDLGLNRPIAAMGANFGDIDNDGYLDAYFGTGWMSYSGLIPNVMLKNIDGRRFEDVTTATGTGHLQKGHGVSFADHDGDGDLDLFVVLGGAYPGDRSYNALFQNPGHGRHWLKVKLVGTRTNRSAIGARIQADVNGPDGRVRSIYRTIGNNGSFGGNTLTETIGLSESASVARLIVSWPTSRTNQTFPDVPADQEILITEGTDGYKVIQRTPVSAPAR
jgi:tetratricopeptide (TPR) repeat protein